jgi:hypothetical protein
VTTEAFRCAYCGRLTPLDQGTIYYTWTETMEDGTELFAPAVYCSPWCGESHSRGSVGRG